MKKRFLSLWEALRTGLRHGFIVAAVAVLAWRTLDHFFGG